MEISSTINDLARSVVDRITGSVGSQLVFGPAYEAAGRTVIPVSEVRYGFGLGAGAGSGSAPDGQGQGSGGGGGAGGGVQARPVGFIDVTGERAEFFPIVDYTRIALAGLVALTTLVLTVSRVSRRMRR